MSDQHCVDCCYYLQHYTFNKQKIFRVHCGHCTLNRARRRQPDAKAYESFTPGTAPEEAFVSKEYLNKELLQYMLNLELLPEIKNRE